jgi:hypothetical protein
MKRFIIKSFLSPAKFKLLIVFLVFLSAVSCEKDYFPVPPPPKVPKETTKLEASYTASAPIALNAKYWKEADFLKVAVSDLSTAKLYGDGLLNMTGTYNGKASFNGGTVPEVTMKAGYDDTKLYILVEWTDSRLDAIKDFSIFDGPSDPLKNDDNSGWTLQGNSDKLALSFEIEPTSSSAGTFSNVGCAASCHNGNKKPETGKVDIWNWNLGISAPMGYAQDMLVTSSSGLSDDAGQTMAVKNKVNIADNRSAPAYEWNGVAQTVTHPDGKGTSLDPGYYLLNKVPFVGNPVTGKNVYMNNGCNDCHGDNGEGGDGSAFNVPGFNRKYTRETLLDYSGSSSHTGQSYFTGIPASQYDDLFAYLRGIGGIPGYYLQAPTGSNADIWTVSGVSLARLNVLDPITKYQVLLVRKLVTNNPDDAQFNSPEGKVFVFGLALMDNDGKNHIGSFKETLKFIPR